MKRKILLGCLLPLLIVGGLAWYGTRMFLRADPKPERFATADIGDVEIKVTETGVIEPVRKVEVKSKVAGRIARLLVTEGSRVQAGQLLAEIDPTEINSQVEQIRAQWQAARARLEQARRSVDYQIEQTRSAIEQGRESVAAAEARLRVAQEQNRAQPGLSQSELQQAEAALRAAEQARDLLNEATHPQAMVQARSDLADAQESAEAARRNLERQKRLLERGFASEQAVDQARAQVAATAARLEQALSRLALIDQQHRLELSNAESRITEARAALERARANQSQVAIRAEEVRSARAALQQAKAQLRAAESGRRQDAMRRDEVAAAAANVAQIENQLREFEVRQRDTTLVSPMSGVVTKRYIEQGELVTSGVSTFSTGTPVLQVADLSRMLVKMSVNEVDVQRIRMGLPVEILIDGARGTMYAGRVRKVAPASMGAGDPAQAAQQAAGAGGVVRFAVEIEIERPDARVKPGMTAKCTIVIARRKNVLRLPTDSVERVGDKRRVQLAVATRSDGKTTTTYSPRDVTVGLEGDSFTEIISGLKKGDRVKPGVFTGPKRRGIEMNFGGGDERRREEQQQQ